MLRRTLILVVVALASGSWRLGAEETKANFSLFPDGTPLSGVSVPGMIFAEQGGTWAIASQPHGKGLQTADTSMLEVTFDPPLKSTRATCVSVKGIAGGLFGEPCREVYARTDCDPPSSWEYDAWNVPSEARNSTYTSEPIGLPGCTSCERVTRRWALPRGWRENEQGLPCAVRALGVNSQGVGSRYSVTLTEVGGDPCRRISPGPVFNGGASERAKGGRIHTVSWERHASSDVFYKIAGLGRDQYLVGTSTSVFVPGRGTFIQPSVTAMECYSTAGEASLKTIPVDPASEALVLTSPPPSIVASAGATQASTSFGIRNTGRVQAFVTLAWSGDFFTVLPVGGIAIPGGATWTFTVSARPSSLGAPGFRSGHVTVTRGGATLLVPATLLVTASAPSNNPGVRVQATENIVSFSSPAGHNPPPRKLTVRVDPGAGPLTLHPTVHPGGSWLEVGPPEALEVPPSGLVELTLSVDRTRRTAADGTPPLRTLLHLGVLGAEPSDAALVEVVDVETTDLLPGTSRTVPPSGGSIIVPAVVNASGEGSSFFFSDGWLTNLGEDAATVEFVYTPQGLDGLTDPAVRKLEFSIPSGATARLLDLVPNLLRTQGSGQLEIRSAQLDALALRVAAEALTKGDPATRYGSEIPVAPYGGGARAGVDFVIPGVSDDVSNRTNVILAETSGRHATAQLTVFDESGDVIGAAPWGVPPYGKVQVNRVVDAVAPGKSVTGGWIQVGVSGEGTVFPVATIIDNASNSFSAVRGVRLTSPESTRGYVGVFGFIIPTAVRVEGMNKTLFSTSLSLVNTAPSPMRLRLVYHYVDQADGNSRKTTEAKVTLPAHGTLPRSQGDDVVAALFGLTTPSYGWIGVDSEIEGQPADAALVGAAAVRAAVDPADASKGYRTSQVRGLRYPDPEFLADYWEALPSLVAVGERSAQRRSNLILVNTVPYQRYVAVEAWTAAGELLGQRTFTVEPLEYKQVNDVFGYNGFDLGDGDFQNVVITARVAGYGMVGLLSVSDNVSRNPEVYVLRRPGPPAEVE